MHSIPYLCVLCARIPPMQNEALALAHVRLTADSLRNVSVENFETTIGFHLAVVANSAAKLIICAEPFSHPPFHDELVEKLLAVGIINIPDGVVSVRCSIYRVPGSEYYSLSLHNTNKYCRINPDIFVTAAKNNVVIYDPNSDSILTTTRALPF